MESVSTQPQSSAAQYGYFDRSFKAELAMFMVFGPALVALWTVTAYALYYYNRDLTFTLLKISLYFTTAMIFTLIFYGNARTLARYKSVIVEEDRIVKKSARGINALNCADISGIRPLKIPFIKRWAVLESPGRWFLLPLKVRNGHEMVEKIFGIVAGRGTILKNSDKTKARLCAVSRRFNVLHDMRVRNMPNLLWAVTIAALFNGSVALLCWERGFITALAWGFVGMLFQIETYFWAEKFHLKNLLRGREDESAGYQEYYVLAGVIGILLTMAVSVFVTNTYPYGDP
jgi:hypothetical protein